MWKLIETWLKTLKWSKLRSIQRFSISKCSNWYNRSICTLLYINMTARNRSLCTKFILYAIILYGDQIVRRSIFMAPSGAGDRVFSIERGNVHFPHLRLLRTSIWISQMLDLDIENYYEKMSPFCAFTR